jgi:hypothetical protein
MVPAMFKPGLTKEIIRRLRKSLVTVHETIPEIKGYPLERM